MFFVGLGMLTAKKIVGEFMSIPYHLTDKQISDFKENGYLIIEKFIEEEILRSWRVQLWNHLESDLEDRQSWPNDYVMEGFSVLPPEHTFGSLPQVNTVIEQLGGGMFSGGGGQILAQWPKQDQEWSMPSSGHIDGYGPNGWSGGFMLGATTYLYDVEPKGGAFIYWPKSHFSTHEYFREFPEQIDGSFNKIEDWGWHIFSDRSPGGPTQYIAKAGSVVFWHCFLCHTGSGNIRSIPRFGLFARWSYKEKEKMRYEIPEDLWKYWTI